MGSFTIADKQGFKVIDPYKPVIIRDNRGILFYSTEDLLPRVFEFNLPHGNYISDLGNFKPSSLVHYPLAKLPSFERDRNIPSDFSIEFANNQAKCSVLWNERKIIFDNKLKDWPLPNLMFILYHEYGHAKYTTEKYCDLYASNFMLIRGFNPSQIARAQILSLSEKQEHRKEFLSEQIISNYGN